MDEEAWAEQLAGLQESDKTEERFRDLAQHEKIPGMETAWMSKVAGDT